MSMIPTANSNPIWIRITSNQYKHIKIIPFRAAEVVINYKLVGGWQSFKPKNNKQVQENQKQKNADTNT